MRHPTNGQSEDDLSRLTGSSNSTPSSSSSSSSSSSPSTTTPSRSNSRDNLNSENNNEKHCLSTQNTALILRVHHDNITHKENLKNSLKHPSYLPNILDPLEWQKSNRKRKDRQDSTSSSDKYDRKLVRSNSEEFIPNSDYEVIRRVASHEEFKKKPTYQENNENEKENILRSINENVEENNNNNKKYNNKNEHDDTTSVGGIHHRLDTSPARSNLRWSPNRGSDDSDCENERRRSSERFSKTRAPPGRKSGLIKKKHGGRRCNNVGSANGCFGSDETSYKYDVSQLKYERRGFVSKFKLEERNHRKEEAADGEKINDYNDNNLIDLNMKEADYKNQSSPTIKHQNQTNYQQNIISHAETLPWVRSTQQDQQTPVLCRRFASSQFQTATEDPILKLSRSSSVNYLSNNQSISQNQQNYQKQLKDCSFEVPPEILIDVKDEPIKSLRNFTKMENLKSHVAMQCLTPLGLIQGPDERLKYINKKLGALKKRVSQLEENHEKNYGYRLSQQERYNDKQIKGFLAEISKLRKEKHDLKSNPMTALCFKTAGGMDSEKKLSKMKEILAEINKKLSEKRIEFRRSENLDVLNSEQLIQEKTALQHSLLYFESLFGRPSTREERDIARPIYDRYRIVKRMVTRSVTVSGVIGSELPTILEHEALTYEPMLTSISTDTSVTSAMSSVVAEDSTSQTNLKSVPIRSIDSPDFNTESLMSQSSCFEENIHQLSLDELWQRLEKVRDEKKELKKIIREFEDLFEEQNGRKMLKQDRKQIDDTYSQYKEKKAKVRLLQALVKKQMAK